jgi:2'-5' RNA ligase
MYFMAVVLPPELDAKILPYKKWMAEKYNCKVGLKSPAHITIISPFWMEEEKEVRLQNDILQIATLTFSFNLSTDNFSSFKPRTLFVAVKENEPLNELRKKSGAYFNSQDYKIKNDNRPFHPHITIATRDLHKRDFAEAWLHLENKKFEEEFEATGLSLLKHNGTNWDVVYTAKFGRNTDDTD